MKGASLTMAISQAMWVHGHSLQAEDPTLSVGRIGWAAQLRHLNSQGWYHLAIPTSVIITDIRARIDAAMIQFSSGNQGTIQQFHVYDGDNRIATNTGLNLTGTEQFARFTIPLVNNARPAVQWGIGISIFAVLGADPANAWIDIHSGGVDLV